MTSLARIKWFGTAVQILGVFALSSRAMPASGAFAVMLAGSVVWLLISWAEREWSVATLHAAFTTSNLIGIARWLA